MPNLVNAILQLQQQARSSSDLRSQQRGRMVLGGSSGSAGGSGGPPGGFVGKLTQSNVCYDTTEAESLAGITSLVDNLNHIRSRVATQEGLSHYLSQAFTDTDNVSVTHSFGKYPTVVALSEKGYGWGSFWGSMPWGGNATGYEVLTPSSVDHLSLNNLVVTLSVSKTGYIVCIA